MGLAQGLNVRGGVNALNVNFDATLGDIPYKTELDLLSYSLLMDWHVFGGSFRVSGGALVNQNEATLVCRPSGSIVIGGTSYPVDDVGTLTSRATYAQQLVPYLGIGWGNALASKGRFGLLFDLGAVYTGSPRITLAADGPMASDPAVQQSVAQEQRDIQSQVDRYKFYPVVSLSLYFRF